MRTGLPRVSPQTELGLCMTLMTEPHSRCLPVCNRDELVGVVSIGNLVAAIIDERRPVIDQLSDYITQGCAAGRSGAPAAGPPPAVH